MRSLVLLPVDGGPILQVVYWIGREQDIDVGGAMPDSGPPMTDFHPSRANEKAVENRSVNAEMPLW